MRRLVTIGTGSGSALRGRGGPCHLIETDDTILLLDCGEGAAGTLRSLGFLLKVEYIIITHLHPDHISGIVTFIQNSRLDNRSKPLRVFLPGAGIHPLREFLRCVYLYRDIKDVTTPEIHLEPLTTGEILKVDHTNIKAWKSDHFTGDIKGGGAEREAFGVTVESGTHRLIYTSDVGSLNCFENELQPGCTLLSEAMHVECSDVIAAAQSRKAVKVIFTHVDPDREKEIQLTCSENDKALLAHDCDQFKW